MFQSCFYIKTKEEQGRDVLIKTRYQVGEHDYIFATLLLYINPFLAKSSYLNFHPLEVVSR